MVKEAEKHRNLGNYAGNVFNKNFCKFDEADGLNSDGKLLLEKTSARNLSEIYGLN